MAADCARAGRDICRSLHQVQWDVQFLRDYVFWSANAILIRDTNTALPYPAEIQVSGLTGTVARVTVTLSNFSHSWPSDIDALLARTKRRGSGSSA
jgi:hypothetical protein